MIISFIFYIIGTAEEIEKALTSFGINNVHCAMSNTGVMKADKHKEFLKMIKKRESYVSPSVPDEDLVIVPSQTDVLLGRGKPIQFHPGNVRLALIVETLLNNYDDSAKRKEKTKLAEQTVDKMVNAGVRFLTKTDGLWGIASHSAARERVSSTFRTVRDRRKLKEETMGEGTETTKATGKRDREV